MSRSKLAMFGGDPIRTKPFGIHPVTDFADVQSVLSPFVNHCFSGFRAGQEEGGPCVQKFEKIMQDLVRSKHSIAFDTWSNGLFAILLALGVRPGDEVILPAYTMTACASSVLACGAVPVFADISEKNYCIDHEDIKNKLSPRTKVVMVVHIFGMPADMDRIKSVVEDYNSNIFIMEDVAQAPLASYKDKYCGMIGDVGGYSFTESKHVMSCEGGIAVTNNDLISNGLKYVRNHGEVNSLPNCSMPFADNMIVKDNVGFNFRLTELSAALGCSQLSKLEKEIKTRRSFAKFIDSNLVGIDCLSTVDVDYDFEHSYYCYTLKWEHESISRNKFSEALAEEGIVFRNGYCQPIYKQHIYHDYLHWALKDRRKEVNYEDLPMTEEIDSQLLVNLDIRSPNTMEDMEDVVNGIHKVVENLGDLE